MHLLAVATIQVRSQAQKGSGLRIYVVRHEKRSRKDASFLSPLLPEGHRDAKKLLSVRISDINPTRIYCSPFLRVLQTIKPYLEKRESEGCPISVNVEYSLYESPNPDGPGFVGEPLDGWAEEFFLKGDYVPYLAPEKLKGEWGFGRTLSERTSSFLAHLRDQYGQSNERILLVSHQYTIHSLLSLTTGQEVSELDFPQGEIAELEW
eukprot:CAMPEP_0177615854 /NCGR_PEP_ID=MMETSP0419_2-20121207/23751_1 /TAXON_ID=582737 /ORGANISM="Tetraselmis sp., Strain GSL018" /LENGTH=206 /DNA_ID=CAMNT_0019113687 /DNA_START=612 /DNA_END=1229 /DNA_ORIENTATION=+